MAYPYIYRWNRCGRKGQLCKVTARGKMNSCRVESLSPSRSAGRVRRCS